MAETFTPKEAIIDISGVFNDNMLVVKVASSRRKLGFTLAQPPMQVDIMNELSIAPNTVTYMLEYNLTTPTTFGMDDIVGLRDNSNELTRSMSTHSIGMFPSVLRLKAEIERHLLNVANTDFLRKYNIMIAIDQDMKYKDWDNANNTFDFVVQIFITFMPTK